MAELRQIRTLRLGASRREQVTRAAIALEDALRTASLPRLPRGAILLVRRLDLGRLPADASPQWLSRHIETRLRSLQLAAIRPSHEVPAIWFADRSAALAALLVASLQGAPRAWYWTGVLPGWRPGTPMGELLPLVLCHAAAEPEAATGVAALLDRLLRQGRLDAVLTHLEQGHVASIARSMEPTAVTSPRAKRREIADAFERWPPGEASRAAAPPPAGASEPAAIASAAWRDVLIRWVRRWGAADRRSGWLAAHALVAVHGPAAAVQAERLVEQFTALRAPSRADPIETRPDRPARRSLAGTGAAPPAASGEEAVETSPGPDPTPAAEQATAPDAARPDAVPPSEPDWQPSRAGGLLLLLPAIARLEIAEADPEGDLCLRLLHRIADRLKIRADDAIRRALPEPLRREGPWHFMPPDAWRDLLRLPRRLDLGREEHLLAACQLALARFLRRYARISPRRLVRRPALMHATPTHIDLCFDARWVELEVRLAGLDLDPGWVPWLGRVVTFHYDYEGQP